MSVPGHFDTSTGDGRRAAARHRPDAKAWFGLPSRLFWASASACSAS